MSNDGSASVFCFTPLRLPVNQLERVADPTPMPALDRTPAHDCSAPAIPTGPCPVCPRLAQEFEPWRQASYWKAMHDRARRRAALLQADNEQLRAQVRLREQQLFGRKTETRTATAPATTTTRPGALPRRR